GSTPPQRGPVREGHESAQARGGTMELREALEQISAIRQQVARTEVFRGYRAVPVAFSGVLALLVAGLQTVWVPDPRENIIGWLALWVGAAVISLLAMAVEIFLHCRQARTSLTHAVTWLALGQFAPAIVAGGLLTVVLTAYARDSLWMLPGLWAMLF